VGAGLGAGVARAVGVGVGAGVTRAVGVGVGAGRTAGVGLGLGVGAARTVGVGVAVGLGAGVGLGVGRGVGVLSVACGVSSSGGGVTVWASAAAGTRKVPAKARILRLFIDHVPSRQALARQDVPEPLGLF
jgi:hypothetical protein